MVRNGASFAFFFSLLSAVGVWRCFFCQEPAATTFLVPPPPTSPLFQLEQSAHAARRRIPAHFAGQCAPTGELTSQQLPSSLSRAMLTLAHGPSAAAQRSAQINEEGRCSVPVCSHTRVNDALVCLCTRSRLALPVTAAATGDIRPLVRVAHFVRSSTPQMVADSH